MLPGKSQGGEMQLMFFTLNKTTVIQFLNTQDYEDQSTLHPRRGKA